MFFTQLDNFFFINQPIFATKERSKPGQLWTPAPHANILSHELAGNRKAEQEIAAEVMIWAEFLCSFAESGKEREQKREREHPPGVSPAERKAKSPQPSQAGWFLSPARKTKGDSDSLQSGQKKGKPSDRIEPNSPHRILFTKKIKYKQIFSPVIWQMCPVRQEEQSCWRGESAPRKSVWKEQREKSIPAGLGCTMGIVSQGHC